MNQFREAKAPLNMLKVRMRIKADKNVAYQPFYEAIDATTTEQTIFLDELETAVALAETIDSKQDCFFQTCTVLIRFMPEELR